MKFLVTFASGQHDVMSWPGATRERNDYEDYWTVEIDSLDDLINFGLVIAKDDPQAGDGEFAISGGIVVDPATEENAQLMIIVYDDYLT